VGLLQRAIEAEGIPTIGITLLKEVTKKVKPPRALYPLGEALAVKQQRTILLDALQALETITEPGTILEPGYLWRRHRFE